MITPYEFLSAVRHLAEAYRDQGLSLWERQDNIRAAFNRLPDVAKRSLLNDLALLSRNLPDLHVALTGQENARQPPQQESPGARIA